MLMVLLDSTVTPSLKLIRIIINYVHEMHYLEIGSPVSWLIMESVKEQEFKSLERSWLYPGTTKLL